MAGQGVIVRLARQRAGARVEQFLQPEGVHRQRGRAQVRGAGEHAFARGIVDGLFARSAGALPVHQPVERVVAERGCHPVVRPAALVAPAVVARAGERAGAALRLARRADGIDTGELVWGAGAAGTVERLFSHTLPARRFLPDLPRLV